MVYGIGHGADDEEASFLRNYYDKNKVGVCVVGVLAVVWGGGLVTWGRMGMLVLLVCVVAASRAAAGLPLHLTSAGVATLHTPATTKVHAVFFKLTCPLAACSWRHTPSHTHAHIASDTHTHIQRTHTATRCCQTHTHIHIRTTHTHTHTHTHTRFTG